MNEYLKSYHMKLTAITPIFIGNGKEINKKEYLFLPKNKLGILNIEKLYSVVCKKGLAENFEKYILSNTKQELGQWLEYNKISLDEISKCIKYTLDSADVSVEKTSRLQILEFVKDQYFMPYVPGSSIKGMLRTILLANDILTADNKYNNISKSIERNLSNSKPRNRSLLNRDAAELEAEFFNTLNRNQKRKSDALNDVLSGVIISDSKPISIEDITLCQRIERHTKGIEKKLNILRECIKPDTDIEFDITIDTTVCDIDIEDIMSAIKNFNDAYFECFISKFSGIDRIKDDTVFLGGGTGFVSKTVVYPLYGDEAGVEVTKEILVKTGTPTVHKHINDHRLGVSPHIIKCTKYKGQTLQMGMCKLSCLDK